MKSTISPISNFPDALRSSAPAPESSLFSEDGLEEPPGTYDLTEGPCADAAGNVYSTDQPSDRIYRYGLDGSAAVFMDKAGRSDGMTIDSEGNLYLAGGGVTIFNRDGALLARIAVPEPWTSNFCFGGMDRDILFITASAHVYSIRTRVRGVFSLGK
jgi:gluconolactonase